MMPHALLDVTNMVTGLRTAAFVAVRPIPPRELPLSEMMVSFSAMDSVLSSVFWSLGREEDGIKWENKITKSNQHLPSYRQIVQVLQIKMQPQLQDEA